MSDFNPSPYRGDANIGHVSEELFKMYFVGSNVSMETSCKSPWAVLFGAIFTLYRLSSVLGCSWHWHSLCCREG